MFHIRNRMFKVRTRCADAVIDGSDVILTRSASVFIQSEAPSGRLRASEQVSEA